MKVTMNQWIDEPTTN